MALRQKSGKQQLVFKDGRNEDDNMPCLAADEEDATCHVLLMNDVALEQNDDEDLKKKRQKVPRAPWEKPGRSLGRPVCGAGKKKRGTTSSAQKKKQPIAPVMGYYKTVAKLFAPGDLPMPRVPQMLIEVKEEDAELRKGKMQVLGDDEEMLIEVKEEDAELRMGKIRVIGEVWCNGTLISGEGGLKKFFKRGRHLRTMPDSKQNIETEAMERLYCGFISATLKPTVSGSCFSVCRVDPRLKEEEEEEEEGGEAEEEEGEEEEYQHPVEVRTKEGDILCKFTVTSISHNQKKPDVQTHLMRLLPLSSITKLNDEGISDEVFKAWSIHTPAERLSKVVECLGMVVDGL